MSLALRYAHMRWVPGAFTCWEAARQIKCDAGAGDIGARPGGLVSRRHLHDVALAGDQRFCELKKPAPWCLVLLTRRAAAHVGVWTGSAMAHLSETGGVRVEPVRDAMRALGYLKASYHDLEDRLH